MACCVHFICRDTVRNVDVLTVVDGTTVNRYDLDPGGTLVAFAGNVGDLDCISSGGNTVTLTNDGQVITHTVDGTPTTHDLRIPQVDTFPTDDTQYPIVRMVGNADPLIADGLYWYNQTISQWVES